ncbi:hypothetical protein FDB15_14175 [Clostridium botulinum]|uniref:hypothetical protein n=1 Tax=unclassified Clostridium TaxID=2614128 RepID=UPI0005042B12|nr:MULTISPECIES: hypothetical protein [unclassified Clostridium]AIY79188.1 hypothetical protein U728_1561 [Clostridium botulinum 202F]KAI3344902.1 hypothetical protein CIT17_14890 [Clostridium botulinum]KFX53795.1 hypothetical protein KU40_17670 [Clostridium botulinum]KON13959.1 hypothetical protein ACP50_07840 [Clostridium botulinum]MBY6780024.1 hypothetical protein [Clostridium botulinum]
MIHIINVVNSGKLNNSDLATPGNSMPRCPHCKHVTLYADILDEILQKEIELYSKKYSNLKFDK